MNENSTQFSLRALTQRASPSRSSQGSEDDSGLIDLNSPSLAPAGDAPPAGYGQTSSVPSPFAGAPLTAPPPLFSPGESTLSGLAAHPVSTTRRKPPGWLWGLGACLLSAAFGFTVVRLADSAEEPVAPAATAPVAVEATVPSLSDPDPDRKQRVVEDQTPASEPPALEPDADDEPRISGKTARATTATPSPQVNSKPSPPKRVVRTTKAKAPKEPSSSKPKESATGTKRPAKKDPCAHCGTDLACAMRCSVRGSP